MNNKAEFAKIVGSLPTQIANKDQQPQSSQNAEDAKFMEQEIPQSYEVVMDVVRKASNISDKSDYAPTSRVEYSVEGQPWSFRLFRQSVVYEQPPEVVCTVYSPQNQSTGEDLFVLTPTKATLLGWPVTTRAQLDEINVFINTLGEDLLPTQAQPQQGK